jgi:glycosyltransferase involved in cell wall biosynthesis
MHAQSIVASNYDSKDDQDITYFAVCHDGPTSGVGKKIRDQLDAWQLLGFETSLHVITLRENRNAWKEICPGSHIWVETALALRILLRIIVQLKIRRDRARIVFFRDSFPYHHLKPSKNQSHVLEVNSLQKAEIQLHGKAKFLLFKMMYRQYYRSWRHFNFVTDELRQLFIHEELCDANRAMVFPNSINLQRIQVLPVSQKKEPRLIFIGHPGLAWNGIDQIMELANSWPAARFHVVGESKQEEMSDLQNVFFHGYLSEEHYREIAADCHIAIGTLGLQSKSMTSGSALKTREYLALGLPVVIRYREVDFGSLDSSFILTLPLDSRPISTFQLEIVKFLDKWKHQRVPREAIVEISHVHKEAKRVKYFRTLMNSL